MAIRHLPVMPEEVVEHIGLKNEGVYIDATVGQGGHAEEMLKRAAGDILLIGIDRDEEALAATAGRISDRRLVLRKARFSEMGNVINEMGIKAVDGVLFDLGVSMRQMKDPSRGFSFDSDELLDMRMDRGAELTAEKVVNSYTEAELERILREYGEERHSRKVARFIAERRKRKPIRTCRELAGIVYSAIGRRGRIHPATRTFQAVRVEVNNELGELREGLVKAHSSLRPGGRMVVISYHSLEDRMVKNYLREARVGGTARVLTKKPLRPGREEVVNNPSSRSARLRALEAI